MNRGFSTLAGIVLIAGLAGAGEFDEPAPVHQPAAPKRQRGNNRGRKMKEFLQSLPDRLKMSEKQRKNYTPLLGGLEDKLVQFHRDVKGEAGPLRRQLRQAEDEGDTETAAKLKKQLRELHAPRRAAIKDFQRKVHAMLTPEQKRLLREIRPGGGPSGKKGSFRKSLQALKKLDLSRYQRRRIRRLLRANRQKMKNSPPTDPEVRKERNQQLKKQIETLLTPRQRTQWQSEINTAP